MRTSRIENPHRTRPRSAGRHAARHDARATARAPARRGTRAGQRCTQRHGAARDRTAQRARRYYELLRVDFAALRRVQGLREETIADDLAMIERLRRALRRWPWQWREVPYLRYKDARLRQGRRPATLRTDDTRIAAFCAMLSDPQLPYAAAIRRRFGCTPRQIVTARTRTRHGDEGRRRALERWEIRALLALARQRIERIVRDGGKGYYAAWNDLLIVALAYAYGLRAMELASLNTDSWHPHETFPQFGPFGQVRVIGKAKPGGPRRPRWVLTTGEFRAIVPLVRFFLAEVRPGYAAQLARLPGRTSADGNAFFLSDRGRRLRAGYIGQRFAELRRDAQLDADGKLHGLRHSHATHGQEDGQPERFMQWQLGWESSAMLPHYTHISPQARDRQIIAAQRRRRAS